MIDNQEITERIIIVGVETPQNFKTFEVSIKELQSLAEVAGGEIVDELTQSRDKNDSKTLIGKGKLEELIQSIETNDATTVIFNERLTPRQLINLETATQVKVLDRMQLILDIFSLRAKSREGQLQVELAQLNYLLPRLSGQGITLSRQAGGIGSRGPGEKKLETDKRHLQSRVLQIKNDLKTVERKRDLNREERINSGIYKIGLVGYTNAGKSTLFEKLTASQTLVKDQLFATLDPLSKKIEFENGFQAVLTDTVGFIQDLPTELVQAFKSTLEESRHSDLLIHVVDSSHPDYQLHEAVVEEILGDLKMSEIPILTVYNKKDLNPTFSAHSFNSLLISAIDDQDIELLQNKLLEMIANDFIPFEYELPVEQAYKIYDLKRQVIINSEILDEKKNIYLLKGFANPDKIWLVK